MADINMLTTIDNPFNPFTQYDEWLRFDEEKGYFSNALLARVIHTSDTLTDTEQNRAREQAIEEIVNENVSGVHTKFPQNSET